MTAKIWSKKSVLLGSILMLGSAVAAQDQMEDRFAAADANGDGTISHEEMLAKVREKFAEFDKDKDGFLTLEELPKDMPMLDHMRGGMRAHGEHMGKFKEKWRDRRGMDDADDEADEPKPTRMHFIVRHDKDGDERVSFDEFSAMPLRHFKHMDLNGDGAVSKAEADEARSRMHDRMGEGGERHGKPHR